MDDLPALRSLLDADDPRQALRASVEEDFDSVLRELALKTAGIALLGGALAAAAVAGRRLRVVALGALGGLVVVVVAGVIVWADYDAGAFAEPHYSGALERAPEVLAAVNHHIEDLGEVEERIDTLSDRIAGLYAVVDSEPVTGDDVVLHVSDIHSNPIGLELTQQLAEAFDVDAVLDTGDLTSFGVAFEPRMLELIDGLEVPYLFVPGNHDSPENRAAIAAREGVQLLDGETARIGSVLILGVADPTFTADGNTSQEEAAEVKQREADRVAELVRRTDPDVLAVHDPRLAGESAGLVPLVLAGHVHETRRRCEDGTWFLTVGSTGATGLGTFTVESTEGYEAQVLRFDEGELLAVDHVTMMDMRGGFEVERWIPPPDDDQ